MFRVSLESNLFDDVQFLSHLGELSGLTHLNTRHNPVAERRTREWLRQRAIAEISSLQWMNGSNLSQLERKDAEIYYLKSAFETYFRLK